MQSASSRIWTRVAVFISYDDNHYTTGTSTPSDNVFIKHSDINCLYVHKRWKKKCWIKSYMLKTWYYVPRYMGSLVERMGTICRNHKRKRVVFNRFPIKSECDTKSFYCEEPHSNRDSCVTDKKNDWDRWHFSIIALQAPSDKQPWKTGIARGDGLLRQSRFFTHPTRLLKQIDYEQRSLILPHHLYIYIYIYI